MDSTDLSAVLLMLFSKYVWLCHPWTAVSVWNWHSKMFTSFWHAFTLGNSILFPKEIWSLENNGTTWYFTRVPLLLYGYVLVFCIPVDDEDQGRPCTTQSYKEEKHSWGHHRNWRVEQDSSLVNLSYWWCSSKDWLVLVYTCSHVDKRQVLSFVNFQKNYRIFLNWLRCINLMLFYDCRLLYICLILLWNNQWSHLIMDLWHKK